MSLRHLSDENLIANLKELVRQERENTADVVEHLCEMDSRDLALEKAFPSLFEYCTRELGYSAAAAYFRIRAARAARRFPCVIEMLRSGETSLEAVVRLHPHLTPGSGQRLLDQSKGKSAREVEAMVAPLAPKPLARDSIRIITTRVPEKAQEDEQPLFSRPISEPPNPDSPIHPDKEKQKEEFISSVHFDFTADEKLLALVSRAQEILRHKYPNGRLEDVFRDALIALIKQRDPEWRLLGKLPKAARNACAAASLPEDRK